VKRPGTQHRDADDGPALWWIRSRQVLAAGAVALLIAAVLIPSESAVPLSTHVVLIMAWLPLAALVLLRRLAGPRGPRRAGLTEFAVVLFLIAHGVSALVMLRAGHARPALNALWLWVSFGLVFLVVRQLFDQPLAQRALVGCLVALAAGLSVFGLYQVVYSNPTTRAHYARNPEAALREAGLDAPPGSTERRHYENRLESTEPIGPFALTNSLAGLLAPSLLLLLFMAGSDGGGSNGGRRAGWAMALPALVVGACLVLTKSRSAYGAVVVGCACLALFPGVRRAWLRRSVLLPTLGVVALLGVAAVRWGGLDREVITEAPKSLIYRMEYWRATGAMMADYPWFGCGPGNFQTYYTRYKAPQASETIADPHNFLLEIGATAGFPALVLFVLIAAALVSDLRRGRQPSVDARPAEARTERPADDAVVGPLVLYAGFAAGFVVAFPAGWAGGLPVDLSLLWVAGPAALGTLWFVHSWVERGQLTRGALAVACIALLTNLLAAGGIGFPGVGQWVWVLAALLLNVGPQPARGPAGRGWLGGALAATVLLTGACYVTMYRPVLASRQAMERARQAGAEVSAERALAEAAAADPWWAEPWEYRAELAARQWLAEPTEQHLAAFFAARDALLARDRHSSLMYRRCGDWLLEMFAASERADLGAESVAAYAQAVELYPNSGILHAQLAWACHVTGAAESAAKHAAEALRLDAVMPHVEYKLAVQRLTADYLAAVPPTGANLATETAEQLMHRIRNVKNH